MHKLSGIVVISLSVVLVLALILSGCSNSSTTTSAPTPPAQTTAAPPTPAQTTASAPPKTTTAPPPASSSAAPPPASSAAANPINIGLILAESGPFASMAAYEKPGVQMAVDQFNAAGGIMGRQIQLVFRDDMADPSAVAQKADELKSAGVVGIVGAAIDADNEAISVWAKQNKMPIGTGTSADLTMRTTNFSGYNFFCTPTGWTYANVLAQWAAKQDNIKSIYAIGTDMGANHAIVDAFWPFMNQLKPSVKNAGVIYTASTEQDFSNAISSALAKKPDLLLDLCAGPSGVAFIKQAQQFNTFKQTTVAGPYILEAAITSAFGKDYPVGIQAIDNCPFWLNTPEMQTFVKDFQGRTKGLYPSNSTLAFYQSALSLLSAIKAAGSTDSDKIVAAWEKLTVTSSPVGSYTFDPYDHQGEVPTWMNTSGFSSDYTIAVGLNPLKYQQGIYPTQDQIMALRNAGKK